MSSVTSPTLTPTIANWWLDYYGHGGYKAGSFTSHLMRAITTADTEHLRVLQSVFPGLVEGFVFGSKEPHGVKRLKRIAEQS